MIEIDGSHGEGGGQILRTSISLSAVINEPVRITNIRAGRPNPGLAPSHVTSIEAVAEVADAEVDNLFPGSKEIVFRPGQLLGGEFEFDVGTAGSISLVLQSCLLPALMSNGRTRIVVKGGTDVRWSPPIDYMRLVHLQILKKFGAACDIEIKSRGFYPEGGGEVSLEASPIGHLQGVNLDNRGKVLAVEGIAYAQNLPDHVVTRMKHSAIKRLLDFKEVSVDSDLRGGRSTGAGIVLAAYCENAVLGESVLGARGVKSETLGEGCAENLLETLESNATVDEHMLDQILPYMAVADGTSTIMTEEVTGHADTNLWVIERILGDLFTVEKKGKLVQVTKD